MKSKRLNNKGDLGTGTGTGLEMADSSVRVCDAEAAKAAWVAARRLEELRIANAMREQSISEANRARVARSIHGGGSVAMAPLGEHKASASRRLIERGGSAAEDEARQCASALFERIDDAGAAMAAAAGKLGERVARRWLIKKEAGMGREIEPQTRAEIVAIYRAAGIEAIQSGANGLFSSRSALKAASKAAYSELYRASGRDGREVGSDWALQGSMPRGESSAPDQSAGAGLRPSVLGELDTWATDIRAAFAAKVAAASTGSAKVKASAAAGRAVDLMAGLVTFARGGAGPNPELLAEFFTGGELDGPISATGRKRLQRIRETLGVV